MKRIVIVLALAAVLVALVGASLAAAAPSPQQSPTQNGNGATSETFPIDFNIDSACFGELIEVTGTAHIVNQFVPVQGGWHITSTFNLMNMQGVGLTTGDQYVVNAQGQHFVENTLPTGDVISGTVTIDMVVSKGSSPNQNGQAVLHYIINEDGTVKAEVIQGHIMCTG